VDFGYAILKGIIQGLAEFLPISSTAHLIFIDAIFRALGWEGHAPTPIQEEFFDILLHMGTLAAVLFYFRGDLANILRAVVSKSGSIATKPVVGNINNRQLPIYIAISMVVTVVFILSMLKGTGLIFQHFGWTSEHVKNLSDFYMVSPKFVALHLIITGFMLYFTERFSAGSKPGKIRFATKNALVIGLFQGFAAIFHGLSRSGSTIAGGLLSGVDRLTATRYSFLLSIPTFMMAMVYEAIKIMQAGHLDHLDWPPMIAGTIIAGLVGYFCVKYFIRFVAVNRLTVFAIYCWVVGSGMFLFFQFGA
jgi:undecaprenyl-diphosphatase